MDVLLRSAGLMLALALAAMSARAEDHAPGQAQLILRNQVADHAIFRRYADATTCTGGTRVGEKFVTPAGTVETAVIPADADFAFYAGHSMMISPTLSRSCRLVGTFRPQAGAVYRASLVSSPRECGLRFERQAGNDWVADKSFRLRKYREPLLLRSSSCKAEKDDTRQ